MPRPTLSPGRFFFVWLSIGAQSFGGGTASLALIRRAAVDDYEWITEAEFVRDWALVQLAPGINLLGLIVLIGRQVDGVRGVALALGGLLIPSAIVTVLITALYAHFAHMPIVDAALHGVLPATVGLGLLTAYQMARPLIIQSRKEGAGSLTLSLALIVACAALAVIFQHLPVFALICGAGAISALYHGLRHPRQPMADPEALEQEAEAAAP